MGFAGDKSPHPHTSHPSFIFLSFLRRTGLSVAASWWFGGDCRHDPRERSGASPQQLLDVCPQTSALTASLSDHLLETEDTGWFKILWLQY